MFKALVGFFSRLFSLSVSPVEQSIMFLSDLIQQGFGASSLRAERQAAFDLAVDELRSAAAADDAIQTRIASALNQSGPAAEVREDGSVWVYTADSDGVGFIASRIQLLSSVSVAEEEPVPDPENPSV